MKCPRCKTPDLLPTMIEEHLPAMGCDNCHGSLVSLLHYRYWAENQKPSSEPAKTDAIPDAPDTTNAIRCPKCERIMMKYKLTGTVANRIDVCNVGGLTEAMKVAGWSEAHYVDMMPHNPLGPVCTAATVHFAAAVANFSWLECRATPAERHLGFDDAAIFPAQVRLEHAHYIVPGTPGLGVEVDEARLIREAFKFWEEPHLQRRDGSFTNW